MSLNPGQNLSLFESIGKVLCGLHNGEKITVPHGQFLAENGRVSFYPNTNQVVNPLDISTTNDIHLLSYQQAVFNALKKVNEASIILTFTAPQVEKEIDRIRIDFSNTGVILSDQKILSKTCQFNLLEQLLLQERMHFLRGFIFLNWSDARTGKIIANPKKQFANTIARVKHSLSREIEDFERFGLKIEREHYSDVWSINYSSINNIACNLLKAREFYIEAKAEFEAGNPENAIKKLVLAISPDYYPSIKFIDAYCLLVDCIFSINYKDIPENLLEKAKTFLRWYKARLTNAISIIKKIYIKKGVLSIAVIDDELTSMQQELKRIQKDYKALANKVTVSRKEAEFKELVTLIHVVQKKIACLREITHDEMLVETNPEYLVCESKEFNSLKKNEHVQEIFLLNIDSLRTLRPYLEDKEGTENFLLFNIIQKITQVGWNLCSIREHINKGLKREINLIRKREKF